MNKAEEQEYLARHMVGKYKLGYERVALYLAGFLFEGIINSRVERFLSNHDEIIRKSLEVKIDSLSDKACKVDTIFNQKYRYIFRTYYNRDKRNVFNFSEDNRLLRAEVKSYCQIWCLAA